MEEYSKIFTNTLYEAYNIVKEVLNVEKEKLVPISIYITRQQGSDFIKLKEKVGISRNEAIRRAIDEYLKKELKD
jgi:hypothetical protein